MGSLAQARLAALTDAAAWSWLLGRGKPDRPSSRTRSPRWAATMRRDSWDTTPASWTALGLGAGHVWRQPPASRPGRLLASKPGGELLTLTCSRKQRVRKPTLYSSLHTCEASQTR